ncbi:hypothetical protein [Thiorhodovibrio frisius]|uniref:BioF2-like acetyltransferase domain-containing protein n=1 Tax=Thiorhodovibrio frisius TaxID=631362 RepID=H8Z0A6_9GAMM|nr:hypothetical protein [Thiorhodovibrio frisius]EIC22314.1 hypothetical protein Thi970DRAFT_02567 [Thiorhodovibrio frisius]WPL24611.1 putative protein involved in methicillin resistance [Thiorhodovibrio frisius]
MSKYTIEPVKDSKAWNSFVDASPQGTLFSKTYYLDAAVSHWQMYWICKGQQVKAGLCLVLHELETSVILDDLVIYNGLLFAPDGEQKAAKARLERFAITEFVIAWLTEHYCDIALALAPQFEDMRPFLWHRYHSDRDADKFHLDLRYTSYLDIYTLANSRDPLTSALFVQLEAIRQRNIREAIKIGASTMLEGNGTQFCHDYAVLMQHQGQPQENGKLRRMAHLIDQLLNDGCAMMFQTGIPPDQQPIYSTVFAWDRKRAYYLFGAPAPGASSRFMGTIAFWDAFCWLAHQGIRIVDLEGANSPQRGWFKLSFGGDLRPYYQVDKHAK